MLIYLSISLIRLWTFSLSTVTGFGWLIFAISINAFGDLSNSRIKYQANTWLSGSFLAHQFITLKMNIAGIVYFYAKFFCVKLKTMPLPWNKGNANILNVLGAFTYSTKIISLSSCGISSSTWALFLKCVFLYTSWNFTPMRHSKLCLFERIPFRPQRWKHLFWFFVRRFKFIFAIF